MATQDNNDIYVEFDEERVQRVRQRKRKPRKTDRRVPPEKRGGAKKKNVLLTKEQVRELEKLAAYLPLEQIADYLGIHERTLRERMFLSEEVRAAYERGRARAIGAVAQSLLSKARQGDFRAQKFYLQTQARWTTKHEVKVTKDIDELSDEELLKIATGQDN